MAAETSRFFSRLWWAFEGWLNGDPSMEYWDPSLPLIEPQLTEDHDFSYERPTEEWRFCTHEPKCWRYLPD